MTASAQLEMPSSRRGTVRDAPAALWPTLVWAALGFAGSALLTLAGSRLGGGTVTWWFHPRIGSDREAERLFFYLGVGLLIVAWLGLGTLARGPRMNIRQMWSIAGVWCLPLAVGVPLFSRDIYSYLAQGTLAHLGRSPYHSA